MSRGHAIECRLYAEDPRQDFLPQAGTISLYREPTGPGLRIDSGVREGSTVPVHYDPLLAKVIACAETRGLAGGRAADALQRYVVLGVTTNLLLLGRVLDHPRFREGRVDTGLLDQELDTMLRPVTGAPAIAAAAAGSRTMAANQESLVLSVDGTIHRAEVAADGTVSVLGGATRCSRSCASTPRHSRSRLTVASCRSI